MADERAELDELRRLAELESRATTPPAKPPREAPGAQALAPSTMAATSIQNVLQAIPRGPHALALAGGQEALKNATALLDRGAYKAGGAVTDLAAEHGISPENAALAGYITNVGVQALPTVAGGYIGKKAEPKVQALAEWLMQKAVKPTNADVASGAFGRALPTMFEEGLSPTVGSMDKVKKLATKLDDEVAAAIAGSSERVGVAEAGKYLRVPYERARAQVNPEQDLKAVKAVWDEFRRHPDLIGKTDMPVQLAQTLKQGTYRSLGEKTYGELGSAATESQKQLARGLRDIISAKVPAAVAPLKKESELLNVLSVAENRALAEARKDPAGLTLLAENPYAWAGFMADRSAAFKAAMAHLLYQTKGAAPVAAGAAVGADLGNRMGQPE